MEIHRPCFFSISSYGMENYHKLQDFSSYRTMAVYSNSQQTRNVAESSVEHQKILVPQIKTTSPSNLRLYRPRLPRPPDQESFLQGKRIEFGQFVVREALGEEELLAVAQLRAETNWEDRPNDRYAENLKKKHAEQVFNLLKIRSKKSLHKCFCLVTVRKEESKENNGTNNVLKSVVGTLDLNILYLLTGETFPGEKVKAHVCYDPVKTKQSKHGYIDDLCVAKSARRQGIASNMLLFAIDLAKSNGAHRMYLQVYNSNKPALELYQKIGFQVVERATAQLAKKKACLLCLEW